MDFVYLSTCHHFRLLPKGPFEGHFRATVALTLRCATPLTFRAIVALTSSNVLSTTSSTVHPLHDSTRSSTIHPLTDSLSDEKPLDEDEVASSS